MTLAKQWRTATGLSKQAAADFLGVRVRQFENLEAGVSGLGKLKQEKIERDLAEQGITLPTE